MLRSGIFDSFNRIVYWKGIEPGLPHRTIGISSTALALVLLT